MIKVLQIGLSSNPGGVETCIINYVMHLDIEKFRVDFADIYGEGIAFSKEIRDRGCSIFILPNYKKHPLKMAKELKRILLKKKYDIVHINLLSAANLLPVIISNKYSNSKVIVHSHNAAIPSNRVRRILNNINIQILRNMKVEKWACGEKAGQWMWGRSFQSSNILENAIDVEKFRSPDPLGVQSAFDETGFNKDSIIIGFIGHLVEQKNVMFLPEIMQELNKRSAQYKLLLIGTGPMHDSLEEKFEELGVNNLVFWAGNKNDIENWYHIMNVFILPSRFEGFPMVGVEAQAAGLPCLFSDQISREIKLSDSVKFISIDSGAGIWASEIEKVSQDIYVNNKFSSEKYNIVSAAKRLERKYQVLVNG